MKIRIPGDRHAVCTLVMCLYFPVSVKFLEYIEKYVPFHRYPTLGNIALVLDISTIPLVYYFIFRAKFIRFGGETDINERKSDVGLFQYNDVGFIYLDDLSIVDKIMKKQKKDIEVPWDTISKIILRKQHGTFPDQIVMQLFTDKQEFTFTEDTPGWFIFLSKIEYNLKIDQFYRKMGDIAFGNNDSHIVLYERGSPSSA